MSGGRPGSVRAEAGGDRCTEGRITVVVVAYGPAEKLAGALQPIDERHEIVIVDNSSSPEVRALAAEVGAMYIDPGTNLGFAAAVNIALRQRTARGDVLLLNADARIAADDFTRLHRHLYDRDDLAAVAPALRSDDGGSEVPGAWPWHTVAGAWADAMGLAKWRVGRARPESSHYYLGGAVLLLRAEALAEVGELDERFFLYSEDEDWQRRARARGWIVRLCPDVLAVHAGGGTETDPARLRLRVHAGIERYVRKWYGHGGWAAYRAAMIAGQLVRAAVHRGPRRRADARLAGLYLTGPVRSAQRAGALPSQRTA
jgi:GT2 family glycosyltransferase